MTPLGEVGVQYFLWEPLPKVLQLTNDFSRKKDIFRTGHFLGKRRVQEEFYLDFGLLYRIQEIEHQLASKQHQKKHF